MLTSFLLFAQAQAQPPPTTQPPPTERPPVQPIRLVGVGLGALGGGFLGTGAGVLIGSLDTRCSGPGWCIFTEGQEIGAIAGWTLGAGAAGMGIANIGPQETAPWAPFVGSAAALGPVLALGLAYEGATPEAQDHLSRAAALSLLAGTALFVPASATLARRWDARLTPTLGDQQAGLVITWTH